MGLDIVVLNAGLNRKESGASVVVVAERAPNTENRQGVLFLDPANESLPSRWNDLFGIDRVSLRSAFKTALTVIQQNNDSYMVFGTKFDLPYSDGVGYAVSVDPTLSIIFRHNGTEDEICDTVTVKMISSAGNTFRFNFIAENAIPIFAQKALDYLNQEEALQPIPVPTALAPTRHPVRPISKPTLALNR